MINRLSIIVLGNGGVGKTSLINSICGNKLISNQDTTTGIQLKPWSFKVNQKKYEVNFVDTGGQEVYMASHQFFLTNDALYILATDSSSDYADLSWKVELIKSYAPSCPILLAIHKCDLVKENKLIEEYALAKHPNIKKVVMTSSKDGQEKSIEKLRTVIANIIEESEVFNKFFLSIREDWEPLIQEIKIAKEEKRKQVLKYDEFIKLCEKYSIDTNDGHELLSYLNSIRVCLKNTF